MFSAPAPAFRKQVRFPADGDDKNTFSFGKVKAIFRYVLASETLRQSFPVDLRLLLEKKFISMGHYSDESLFLKQNF